MRFFDYEAIYILANGESKKILTCFRKFKTGYNFILNPRVIDDSSISHQHRAEYLGICSLRSYNDYDMYKEVDLYIDNIPPWISLEVLKENPLVTIKDNKIILDKEKI